MVKDVQKSAVRINPASSGSNIRRRPVSRRKKTLLLPVTALPALRHSLQPQNRSALPLRQRSKTLKLLGALLMKGSHNRKMSLSR